MNNRKKTTEERKRFLEYTAIGVCALFLIGVTSLENQLFSLGEMLSENREFFTTLIYFALINLNVILILIFSFLIFRNVTKLVVERKRGVVGSKLRSKLVIALVFFALAPTLLLFYVTTQFLMTSFETWFSEKVQITMEKTQEAGSQIYKHDQKRLESLARIALQRVALSGPKEIYSDERSIAEFKGLHGFEADYGLNRVFLFSVDGQMLWTSQTPEAPPVNKITYTHASEIIRYFHTHPYKRAFSRVVGDGDQDVVHGSAPLRDPSTSKLLGIIVVEVRFETQILKSVETILSDFADLKPGAQLIRISYMILMIVVVLLIVFSATWLGFYVAREITGPIQNLAEATKEIALGNYNVNLKVRSDDETGQLVTSFNQMTKDLLGHRKETEEAQQNLQTINEELDQKRQYLEVVLKHVTAGVLALDPDYRVTSVNAAAEKLLSIRAEDIKSKHIKSALGQELFKAFWLPIEEHLADDDSFHGQIELSKVGMEGSLIVNALRIFDEDHTEMGCIVVFDDALEKIRTQRVLAWREVARRIAHEIKNPITPIKLNAQRLTRRFSDKFNKEDAEVFQTCMETIISQVDSLRDLVNEFSKFSKLPNINPKKEDLGPTLFEVHNLFRLSYSDIEFKIEGHYALPPFPIDKEQINRGLVNIYTNAVASLEEGRRGVILTRCQFLKELNIVRIEIKDNGSGIPSDLKERVLEPYFSTKSEGTGLGLAIVHQIVTDHGGYLRLGDNEPNGTVVILEFPV